MKYLCLANYRPTDMAAMSPADRQALDSQCPAKDAGLKASGHLRLSASLHPAATLGEQAGWCIEIHAIDFFEQYNAQGVPEAKA